MAVEVLLPKVGLTMTEGTIIEVHAQDGATIAVGDPLMTVATDKVDVEIEAENAGVLHVAVTKGATLAPGSVIAWLLAPGEEPPKVTATAAAPDAAAGSAIAPAAPVASVATSAASANGSGRLMASPNAKRVAGDLGVDLATLTGTGPGGRIVSEDVEEAAASAPAGPAARPRMHPPLRRLARTLGVDSASIVPTGPGGSVQRSDVIAAGRPGVPAASAERHDNPVIRVVPLVGMRGTIARRMHASLQESAQLTHGYRVALDAIIAVREQLKAESVESKDSAVVPSINDFVVKAAALALREHTVLNATIVGDEIHELADIHVGLAVAVPGGLFVPVVQHADELSLTEIAEETRALAGAAREGRLDLDQLEGGTFAVTSLGTYGVEFFTPVINPGNVGILGVGQVRDGVRWGGDTPVRTREATLSLTFDHRAVDGAPAAEYLQTVERLLSQPLRLLQA